MPRPGEIVVPEFDDLTPDEAALIVKTRRQLQGQKLKTSSIEAERRQLDLEGAEARAGADAKSKKRWKLAIGGVSVTVLLAEAQDILSLLTSILETIRDLLS